MYLELLDRVKNIILFHNLLIIHHLQDDENMYDGNPYLFISAGSGGGSGFMYLDWIIVTYGVPYIINVG